jgi:hypothetical protein
MAWKIGSHAAHTFGVEQVAPHDVTHALSVLRREHIVKFGDAGLGEGLECRFVHSQQGSKHDGDRARQRI